MTPKPWEVTDDDLANGLTPDNSADVAQAEHDDDEFDVVEDPWMSDTPATEGLAAAGRETPDTGNPPAVEPTEGITVDDAPVGDPAPSGGREQDTTPSVEVPRRQKSSKSTSESDSPKDNDRAGNDDGDDFEDASPHERANDDADWDDPVPPSSDGYDLGPSPERTHAVGPVEQTVPVAPPNLTGGAGGPDLTAPETDPDGEYPDDSIQVTLRRQRPPSQSRTYRTSEQARRPAKPSQRRHMMAAAPAKQGPLARMKKLLRGESDASLEHETSAKRDTIRPLNVVVLGKKGGVGKTVVTALLGMVFASVRNDRVLAVDASPTGGNLSSRCPREGRGTVVSLLDQLEHVTAYANVREHTAKGATGLEVLGSDAHRPQRPITGTDYRKLMDELRRHYQLVLSDTPGDITTATTDSPEAMLPALLDEADLLVLTVEGVDGANAAVWMVNWLKKHLREHDDEHVEKLLDDLIVVVTSRSPRTNARPDRIAKYFGEGIARRVVMLPFDPAVEGGLAIDFDAIAPRTRKAVLALADAVTGSDAFTGR